MLANGAILMLRAELLFNCDGISPDLMVVNLFKITPNFKEIRAQVIENNSDIRQVILRPNTPVLEFRKSSGDKK